MRTWIAVGLLVAVVASAMAVAVLKHESRQAFAQLQMANETRDQALTEWSRLQLELASLAELGRIEKTAIEELNMNSPTQTQVVVEQRLLMAKELLNQEGRR
ncbi:MAG TPA: cell division protein FtsL [Wenzhouxiangella sp.]